MPTKPQPAVNQPLPVPTPPWKDVLIRAAKTFVQGFIGATGAIVFTEMFNSAGIDLVILEAFATAGLAGGLAAVASYIWNSAVQWSNS